MDVRLKPTKPRLRHRTIHTGEHRSLGVMTIAFWECFSMNARAVGDTPQAAYDMWCCVANPGD